MSTDPTVPEPTSPDPDSPGTADEAQPDYDEDAPGAEIGMTGGDSTFEPEEDPEGHS